MKYIEMAIDLVLSVREFSLLPASVITSSEGQAVIERHYPGLFDQVIVTRKLDSLPRAERLVAAKLECLRRTPYDLTIFLDSDMVCRKDPAFLLDGVGLDDMKVFGRRHDCITGGKVVHHGIVLSRLFEAFALETYVYSSLGAFAYGRRAAERVASAMEEEEPVWREKTRQFRDDLPAELLFGLIKRQSSVSFYDLPKSGRHQIQNMSFRWADEAAFIHSAPMRHAEGRRVMAGVIGRRRRSGFRVGPSLFWVSELLNRRAEQAGLSRRQARFIRMLCEKVYSVAPK